MWGRSIAGRGKVRNLPQRAQVTQHEVNDKDDGHDRERHINGTTPAVVHPSPSLQRPLARRPLRHLDGDGPIGVLVPAAAGGPKVKLLQALGDRPDGACPDGAGGDLGDRRDLEPRARQEDLVGGVELRPVHVALDDRKLHLLLRQLHHGVARDALEYVRRDRRRDELPLADEKDVGRARFGDVPVLGEKDGVVVAGPVRLVHGERGVYVRARKLAPRGYGRIGRPAPTRDAAPEARQLDVVAHRDRKDGERVVPEQVDPDGGYALVGQRPDVRVLARGVALEDLERRVAELVYAQGQVDAEHPTAPLEALVVFAHLQDLQRPPVLAPVGPDPLKDARAVVEGVGGG